MSMSDSRWKRVQEILISGVLVAVPVGFVVNWYSDDARDWWLERRCSGSTKLAQGKALRNSAVEIEIAHKGNVPAAKRQEMTAKHREANGLFQESYNCGVAEAGAYLGQAHCFGWAVPADGRKGWSMIREAVRKDAKLGSEWFNDRYCPNKG
jgi:hypothetical protein